MQQTIKFITIAVILILIGACNTPRVSLGGTSASSKKTEITKTNKKRIMPASYTGIVSKGVPLPVHEKRGGHLGGFIDNRIIIAGGTNWSEDKSTKYFIQNSLILEKSKWTEGPSLPLPIAYSMYACDGSGLYVAGGTSDGVSMLQKGYVLRSLQRDAEWEELPDLPEPIGFGSGALLNGVFYVSGGVLNTGERTNRMWALNLSNLKAGWHECSPIPGVPRILHCLVACGDFLYVLGGLAENSPLTPLQDAFRYNDRNKNWEKLSDLPDKGYAWVAQPINDTNVLITGKADGQIHGEIWTLNLNTMKMSMIGNLIIPSATAPMIKVKNNQWWLIGGEPDSNKNRTEVTSIINIIENQHENSIH